MISVERGSNGRGYTITVREPLSGRYSVHAATVEQASNAVMHYYGACNKGPEACALCMKVAEDARKPKRLRKTEDVWNVQGDYGRGFETVTSENSYAEIRNRLREYRQNEPRIPFRVKMTRERIVPAEVAK